MEYKKKIKIRIVMFAIWSILGAVMFSLRFFAGEIVTDRISSIGIALAFVGVVKMIQNLRLLNNSEKMHEREIVEKDERNIMLSQRACTLVFSIYITLAWCAMLVLFALNREIEGLVLAYSIMGFVLIYYICYLILRRKY